MKLSALLFGLCLMQTEIFGSPQFGNLVQSVLQQVASGGGRGRGGNNRRNIANAIQQVARDIVSGSFGSGGTQFGGGGGNGGGASGNRCPGSEGPIGDGCRLDYDSSRNCYVIGCPAIAPDAPQTSSGISGTTNFQYSCRPYCNRRTTRRPTYYRPTATSYVTQNNQPSRNNNQPGSSSTISDCIGGNSITISRTQGWQTRDCCPGETCGECPDLLQKFFSNQINIDQLSSKECGKQKYCCPSLSVTEGTPVRECIRERNECRTYSGQCCKRYREGRRIVCPASC